MKKTLSLILLSATCFAAPLASAQEPPPRPTKPKVFRGLEVVSVYPHYVGVMREGKFEKVYSPAMTAEERQAFGVLDPDRAKEYGDSWDRVVKREEDNAKAMAARPITAARPAQVEAPAAGPGGQSSSPVGEAQTQPPTAASANTASEGRRETRQEYNDRLYRESQQSAAERAAREKQLRAELEKQNITSAQLAAQQAAEARAQANQAAADMQSQRDRQKAARREDQLRERRAALEVQRQSTLPR